MVRTSVLGVSCRTNDVKMHDVEKVQRKECDTRLDKMWGVTSNLWL